MARYVRLCIHTLSHFAVDFCCFYVLFAVFRSADRSTASIAAGFLLYNILAFGLQAIIGGLCDRWPRVPAARIGCALVLLSLLLAKPSAGSAAAYAALILCALGNAFYHVGGGIDTLVGADGRMGDSGVFVSSGSLGVLFGTLAGGAAVSRIVPLLLIGVCLLLQLRLRPRSGSARFGAASETIGFPAALLLLLVAVVLRAYIGFVVPMPWKTGGLTLYLPAFAAFAGKAMGGYLADRFGARRAGGLALLGAAVLLAGFSSSPALCALGVLLFNIPMPITLCACCDLLPDSPGLAFGLTTLALLIGVLPTFFWSLPLSAAPWTVGALTLAALGCLTLATRKKRSL